MRVPGTILLIVASTFAVLTLTTFIGYTAVGMGKFGSQFLPVTEWFPWLPAEYVDQLCAALSSGSPARTWWWGVSPD